MTAISIAASLPSNELTRTPRPARPEGASIQRRPRNPFSVGARFPRRSAAEVFAYLAQDATTPATAAVSPVGARFPRRTLSEILAYQANVELDRRAPVHRSHPVGARFPRLPR